MRLGAWHARKAVHTSMADATARHRSRSAASSLFVGTGMWAAPVVVQQPAHQSRRFPNVPADWQPESVREQSGDWPKVQQVWEQQQESSSQARPFLKQHDVNRPTFAQQPSSAFNPGRSVLFGRGGVLRPVNNNAGSSQRAGDDALAYLHQTNPSAEMQPTGNVHRQWMPTPVVMSGSRGSGPSTLPPASSAPFAPSMQSWPLPQGNPQQAGGNHSPAFNVYQKRQQHLARKHEHTAQDTTRAEHSKADSTAQGLTAEDVSNSKRTLQPPKAANVVASSAKVSPAASYLQPNNVANGVEHRESTCPMEPMPSVSQGVQFTSVRSTIDKEQPDSPTVSSSVYLTPPSSPAASDMDTDTASSGMRHANGGTSSPKQKSTISAFAQFENANDDCSEVKHSSDEEYSPLQHAHTATPLPAEGAGESAETGGEEPAAASASPSFVFSACKAQGSTGECQTPPPSARRVQRRPRHPSSTRKETASNPATGASTCTTEPSFFSAEAFSALDMAPGSPMRVSPPPQVDTDTVTAESAPAAEGAPAVGTPYAARFEPDPVQPFVFGSTATPIANKTPAHKSKHSAHRAHRKPTGSVPASFSIPATSLPGTTSISASAASDGVEPVSVEVLRDATARLNLGSIPSEELGRLGVDLTKMHIVDRSAKLNTMSVTMQDDASATYSSAQSSDVTGPPLTFQFTAVENGMASLSISPRKPRSHHSHRSRRPVRSPAKASQDAEPRGSSMPVPSPSFIAAAAAASAAAVQVAAKHAAAEEVRVQGKDFYKQGDYHLAEKAFSKAIALALEAEEQCSAQAFGKSRSPGGREGHTVALSYGNRAATRLMQGRPYHAMLDCRSALEHNASYLRPRLRLAICQLRLGDTAAVLEAYRDCEPWASQLDYESRASILQEIAEGRSTAERIRAQHVRIQELVAGATNAAATFCFQHGNPLDGAVKASQPDPSRALQISEQTLILAPHWSDLKRLHVFVLLTLKKYETAAAYCEEECSKVSQQQSPDDAQDAEAADWLDRAARIRFCAGELELALKLLQRRLQSMRTSSVASNNSVNLVTTIQSILSLKEAGNVLHSDGRYQEASDKYTEALALCGAYVDPVRAVLFSNRAACAQALGRATDAIADCTVAMALNPRYSKSLSRRAALHQAIRDGAATVQDLESLQALAGHSTDVLDRLKQARQLAGRTLPLDYYQLLGIPKGSSKLDVKKAYHRAALRHHPDKAAAYLLPDGCSEDVAQSVRGEADRLFKLVSEAYSVLSDDRKRREYDFAEEDRQRSQHYKPSTSSYGDRYPFWSGTTDARDRRRASNTGYESWQEPEWYNSARTKTQQPRTRGQRQDRRRGTGSFWYEDL
eukprot:jgi/Chlat1/9093/Chrsp97S08417